MSDFKSIVINLISSAIGGILAYLWTKRKRLKNILLLQTVYRKKDIRVSIAYLYRIKIDDKYLLVKSRKIANQYQPVGGVYKYYESARPKFNKMCIQDFTGFNYDETFKDDLRVKVPSRSLYKLIDWFESREDRELDPIREFHEELIDNHHIEKDTFSYFKYRFIKQVITPIKYSSHFNCYEMLIYNIYELMQNQEQDIELRRIMNEDNDYYKWVNADTIEHLGHTMNGDLRIGDHTIYIL